jgi:hypothetical protein
MSKSPILISKDASLVLGQPGESGEDNCKADREDDSCFAVAAQI